MTERKWLAAQSVSDLLRYLKPRLKDGFGRRARKIRLFACACCRRIWDLLTDERSRRAVEVSERYADYEATERERKEAYWQAVQAMNPDRKPAAKAAELVLVRSTTQTKIDGIARWTALHTAVAEESEAAKKGGRVGDAGARTRPAWQAAYLRDVIGNPFRPVAIDPAWRTSAVETLALTAYEERLLPAGLLDRDRLAVLADALEDAGCSVAAILDHLRGPGPHVRGCWALDLVLAKE